VKKILIVAGEASGDLHGSRVAEALQRLDPKVQVWAMGGDHLRRAGAKVLIDSSRLAVVGITEVLGRIRGLFQAYRKLRGIIQKKEVTLVILIDFPDFNLRLARVAKETGVPVLYYISPQVWAWRSGRVLKMARWVEKMAVIFPFEVPIYQQAGLEAEFVGHPLLDILDNSSDKCSGDVLKEKWGGDPLITLLPGSREREVKSLLPEMLRAAEIISGQKQGAKFILAVAPTLKREEVEKWVKSPLPSLLLVEGKTYEAIMAADLVIVASGTATLETAILGKPMVIAYQVSPLSYWVGRFMIKVPWIGLVNIVAGKSLVPELIQGEVRGERIAAEAMRILEDEAYRAEMVAGLKEVQAKLGTPGAAERVARVALEMIDAKKTISGQLKNFLLTADSRKRFL